MSVAGQAKRLPLREGLFEMPAATGDLPRLIGVRCPACGARFANPRVIACSARTAGSSAAR